jgi:hypothetical protein
VLAFAALDAGFFVDATIFLLSQSIR